MDVTIHPTKALQGKVLAPGDKSLSHRALLFAALAEGTTHVDNLGPGADVRSTASCLRQLGVSVDQQGTAATVEGRGLHGLSSPSDVLDCGNSGTTLRLLAGVVAGAGLAATLDGDAALRRRPMRRILDPLRAMGARAHGQPAGEQELPPLVFEPAALTGVRHDLAISSAQVKSCLLLAGLYAEGPTTVHEPVRSRDHSERLFRSLGVDLVEHPDGALELRPPSSSWPALGDVLVPGDPSSAAFFQAAAALVSGSDVAVASVCLNPTRTGFLRALQRMGARVEIGPERSVMGEPVADVRVRGGAPLRAIHVEEGDVPALVDEIPVLAVLATQAEGETVITGAGELRVKECDRLAAMARGLTGLGADVEELADGLRIRGPVALRGGHVASEHDHRIAMSFAVAALVASGPVIIADAEWVDISWPGFFDHLAALASPGGGADG